MQTIQNNEFSESFGMLPQDSEGFGNVPNPSERKENHVLTVHTVARMFEEAGVARTERSVTNWCQPDRNGVSRLDCFYDPNERKYYITPQSVERAIEEERSKIISGELPHVSESFGNVPNPSESFRNIPHASESKSSEQPTNQQNEKINLQPDLMQELEELRVDKRVLEREIKFKEEWIRKLETEREAYVPQLVEQSRTIGYLESKNENLEEEKQLLLSAPVRNSTRIIERHSIDDSDSEDVPQGETQNVVAD
jgi:hypothetical protein